MSLEILKSTLSRHPGEKPNTKELIFTGRRINGKEALSMGLINHCVPSGDAYHKALRVACGLSLKGSFGYKDGLASYQQRHGRRSYVLGSGWGRRMLWATTEHSRPS
ncbi:unnamed protein product [Musa acuminata subsp. malaccensis]|uniref:(wild Malaysian banana) hypothetical protein n=1 Tax=Musa acuminata subsp. malaccensis TaxID=214687 RepID=A0A804LAA1_MUSAM|nr:unnamed protein product [Musa acuminata subsp. malaccensis]